MFKINRLAIVAAIGMLAACSHTVGSQYDTAGASALQPGVTTLDEAKAKLGSPVSSTTVPQGTLVSWSYGKAQLGGAKFDQLSVLFDKDGRMIRVAHQYGSRSG